MSDHLEAAQLEGYLARTLDPAALLAADDHIAHCSACRERAAASVPPIRQLRRSFAARHLSQESLSDYAEGRLSDRGAQAHLRECAQCRAEAGDLRAFVREGKRRPATASPARLWWRLAAAAALCALAIAAVIVLRNRPHTPNLAAIPGNAALPADLAAMRDTALKTGRLFVPPEIAALRGERESQLGTATESQPQLETPVGTGVLSPRPEFRWKPVADAQRYEVVLFDAQGNPAASSGALQSPSWTPPRDLAEGTYFWELNVVVNGKRITAPRPPAPQARFLVITQAERLRLATLAARYPRDHVLLGILYARAGALDDARRELAAAAAGGQKDAQRLLASLASGTE